MSLLKRLEEKDDKYFYIQFSGNSTRKAIISKDLIRDITSLPKKMHKVFEQILESIYRNISIHSILSKEHIVIASIKLTSDKVPCKYVKPCREKVRKAEEELDCERLYEEFLRKHDVRYRYYESDDADAISEEDLIYAEYEMDRYDYEDFLEDECAERREYIIQLDEECDAEPTPCTYATAQKIEILLQDEYRNVYSKITLYIPMKKPMSIRLEVWVRKEKISRKNMLIMDFPPKT